MQQLLKPKVTPPQFKWFSDISKAKMALIHALVRSVLRAPTFYTYLIHRACILATSLITFGLPLNENNTRVLLLVFWIKEKKSSK